MYVGIDLGGTKIEIAAYSEEAELLYVERLPTPSESYSLTLEAISCLVKRVENTLGPASSVGIGVPGSLSLRTGLIKNSYSTPLQGKNFASDISQILGRKVFVANDADCFTFSEAKGGAASGCTVVFGVILGTGVGGGLVIDGNIVKGRNGITGEWGHNPMPSLCFDHKSSRACLCGKTNHIESWISGPAFEKSYAEITKTEKKAFEIIELVRDKDISAMQCFDEYLESLSAALATIVNILDPDVIVLGGGMSNIKEIYDEVPNRWGKYVFSDIVMTKLFPASFGDSSGVRGAALLGKQNWKCIDPVKSCTGPKLEERT